MKTKTFNNILEVKSSNIEGEFSGYASIFNIIDQYDDIILPGAFRQTLIEQQHIQLLWQHDPKEPIGYFSKIKETVYGLYVEGKLLLELAKAREAYLLMQNKVITGLSIGFEVLDSYYAEGARYITSLRLWEISLVTFPANPEARIVEVKSDLISVPETSSASELRPFSASAAPLIPTYLDIAGSDVRTKPPKNSRSFVSLFSGIDITGLSTALDIANNTIC